MRLFVPVSWVFLGLFCVAAPVFAANAPITSGDGDVLIDLGAAKAAPVTQTAPAPQNALPPVPPLPPIAKTATPEPADAPGKYQLGCAKLSAHGVDCDEKDGFRLIAAAAQTGLPIAQAHLGRLYRDGIGTEKNYFEAIKWFRLAYDAGLADGAIDLGLLYFEGKGVHRDLVEAASLLSYASATLHVAPPEAYAEARKALAALPGMLGQIEKDQVRERICEERDRTLHRLMQGSEKGPEKKD